MKKCCPSFLMGTALQSSDIKKMLPLFDGRGAQSHRQRLRTPSKGNMFSSCSNFLCVLLTIFPLQSFAGQLLPHTISTNNPLPNILCSCNKPQTIAVSMLSFEILDILRAILGKFNNISVMWFITNSGRYLTLTRDYCM